MKLASLPVSTGRAETPPGSVTLACNSEQSGSRLLQELLPNAARFAALVNPDNPGITESFVSELQMAASAIGRKIEIVTASTNSGIDTAFAMLVKMRADAFLISPEALFVTRRLQILTLAARHALPALYHRREFTDAGGLMSYGSSLADQFRQTGLYAGRILKGEKSGRYAGPATDQVRVRHQPTNRQNAWHPNSSRIAGPRRRGDRIAMAMSAIGT